MYMKSPHAQVYRIGIDARFFRSATGGIGRYTRELIGHLALIDHSNEYYVFLTEEDVPEWVSPGQNFFPVVTDAKHYTAQEQTTFLKLLYSYKLDLVHFLNFNFPVAYRRPFVVTLHDLTLLHKPEPTPPTFKASLRKVVRRPLFKFVLVSAVRFAKKVIAVSEYTAHDTEKTLGVSHAKMEVVPHGVLPPYQIPFGAKKHVQDYLGTKDPYILFVSQWRSHKGIITLMEAFAELKQQYNVPHKLVLLGRQEAATADVRDALASSPVHADIVTPGFAPDELLPALYTYASAFVMPSEYEGFGLPALEAMNYGAPVILADNSSQPEIGGDAALYFQTGNAHELSQKMAELLGNEHLANDLRQKGSRQVRKFTWDRTAARTHEVYLSVLEKHR
jgi:glycosyltransferase involved in cell wall biosynthesis